MTVTSVLGQSIPADTRPHVAIAILHQENQFLLQLRDNLPNLIYGGYWALFGGHLEAGETPDQAIRRELQEEISYIPPTITPFGLYPDQRVIRHVYHAPLVVGLSELVLGEGWDMGFFTLEDIQRGDRYSRNAQEVRPLGPPHQKILLDFIQAQSSDEGR